jgi:hypothetical protein
LEPRPLIRVYAARTLRWRGIFAVHTWIVFKENGESRYVRYDYLPHELTGTAEGTGLFWLAGMSNGVRFFALPRRKQLSQISTFVYRHKLTISAEHRP